MNGVPEAEVKYQVIWRSLRVSVWNMNSSNDVVWFIRLGIISKQTLCKNLFFKSCHFQWNVKKISFQQMMHVSHVWQFKWMTLVVDWILGNVT